MPDHLVCAGNGHAAQAAAAHALQVKALQDEVSGLKEQVRKGAWYAAGGVLNVGLPAMASLALPAHQDGLLV